MPPAQARILQIFRIALALVILLVLGWQFANWQQVWIILQHTEPIYLVGCIAIYFTGVVLSCIKWRILLQPLGHVPSLWQLIRWYLLGALASNILPSSIGGDLGRGVVAGRGLGSAIHAWSSILAERLTGVAMLSVLAAISLALAPSLFGWPAFLPLLLVGIGVVLAVAGWFGVLVALQRQWLPGMISQPVTQTLAVVEQYRKAPMAVLFALVLSLVFHCLSCISLWLIVRAITAPPPVATLIVFPLVDLVGLVPLTPGGLGLREGAMTGLLGQIGLSFDQALAAAIISRALLLLTSLSGLPVLFAELRLHTSTQYQRPK